MASQYYYCTTASLCIQVFLAPFIISYPAEGKLYNEFSRDFNFVAFVDSMQLTNFTLFSETKLQ